MASNSFNDDSSRRTSDSVPVSEETAPGFGSMWRNLLEHQTRLANAEYEKAVSGSSQSTTALEEIDQGLERISKLLEPPMVSTERGKSNQVEPSESTARHDWIRYDFEQGLTGEKVEHLCDLCNQDLAIDPERPRGKLWRLPETCVLGCGHVYHINCLATTTLDLDHRSPNPYCILCCSSSN